MNKEAYTYYCRLRPPAPGAIPRGTTSINFNEIVVNDRKYWGSVTYDRELTESEIYDYDLDYIQ
jgi:hypothetical protein